MNFQLITCIVERGLAERAADEALRVGAQGVTIMPARGKGVRERLGIVGHLIDPEKEVILVVTPAERTDAVFDAMVAIARLEQTGKGFAFIQPVQRVAGYFDPNVLPNPDGLGAMKLVSRKPAVRPPARRKAARQPIRRKAGRRR